MLNINETCVFILTYGRPEKVITYKALQKQNYSGKIYLICDNTDEKLEEYKKIYKNKVIVFDKKEVALKTDTIDNFNNLKAVVYARNEVYNIAKKLGIKYFCVLDDDYDRFEYRRIVNNKLINCKIKNLDEIFLASFNLLDKCKLIDCFAYAQNGDYIAGKDSFEKINHKRKIMNVFFCKAERCLEFKGSINEDLTCSIYNGQRGKLLLTFNDISINQKITQSNGGGLTDIYLDLGTYVKSFYSVIANPNCCKIYTMGNNDLRIHHKVDWNKCCPKLIREEFKIAKTNR